MKSKKIICLLLLLGMVASTFPVYATHDVFDGGAHIDINDQNHGHVSDIIIYQGESSKIKSRTLA